MYLYSVIASKGYMLVSLTWVMLGITLCHLDLVSCIGSLLGYKRIKNIRLFNLSTALIYICREAGNYFRNCVIHRWQC